MCDTPIPRTTSSWLRSTCSMPITRAIVYFLNTMLWLHQEFRLLNMYLCDSLGPKPLKPWSHPQCHSTFTFPCHITILPSRPLRRIFIRTGMSTEQDKASKQTIPSFKCHLQVSVPCRFSYRVTCDRRYNPALTFMPIRRTWHIMRLLSFVKPNQVNIGLLQWNLS